MGGTKTDHRLPNWFKALLLGLLILVSWSNHNFCLFRKLNVLNTFPRAPFLKPLLLAPMQVMSDVKLGVESNPTLIFVTQFITKATLWWSKLGPWLNELPHLGFHLERHVILPHYRDVNIFVDVTCHKVISIIFLE